ncbi:MAG TPA: peroxiredoxin [Candidatus Acidoferrales bacterium]|nr:peroxiredoxin [Candidatus Acidoferrales bacterium]
MMRMLTVFAVLALSATTAAAAQLLATGDPFPAWNAVDHTGKTVSSSDLAGKKYLLWFYPKAMTAGCTAEGDGLRDKFADLQKANVEVLGVSFDQPQDNARFVQEQQFPFRLLSDRERTLAVAVGAADSTQQPVARRISYLVGADGKVLRVYGAVTPATHAEEVLRDLVSGR